MIQPNTWPRLTDLAGAIVKRLIKDAYNLVIMAWLVNGKSDAFWLKAIKNSRGISSGCFDVAIHLPAEHSTTPSAMVVLVWSLFQYHLLTDRHMGLCKVQVSKAVPDTVDIELVVAEPVQHQTSKYQPR